MAIIFVCVPKLISSKLVLVLHTLALLVRKDISGDTEDILTKVIKEKVHSCDEMLYLKCMFF